jgi:hypothetical protein
MAPADKDRNEALPTNGRTNISDAEHVRSPEENTACREA